MLESKPFSPHRADPTAPIIDPALPLVVTNELVAPQHPNQPDDEDETISYSKMELLHRMLEPLGPEYGWLIPDEISVADAPPATLEELKLVHSDRVISTAIESIAQAQNQDAALRSGAPLAPA